MKSSISLIGMAGAGKSSVGKELANALNFRLIDSDTLIESQYGKKLQNILDDEGYMKLREIENLVLNDVHFNENGSKKVAEIISECINKLIFNNAPLVKKNNVFPEMKN